MCTLAYNCYRQWKEADRQRIDVLVGLDTCAQNHVAYIKMVEPVIWYLAKREQEYKEITDDGLKTALQYARWDNYDIWLEEVTRLSHYDDEDDE